MTINVAFWGSAAAIDGGHWILGPLPPGIFLWALWRLPDAARNFSTWESNCCERCCIGQHRIIGRPRPWPHEEDDSPDYSIEAAMPVGVILGHKYRSESAKPKAADQKTGGAQP